MGETSISLASNNSWGQKEEIPSGGFWNGLISILKRTPIQQNWKLLQDIRRIPQENDLVYARLNGGEYLKSYLKRDTKKTSWCLIILKEKCAEHNCFNACIAGNQLADDQPDFSITLVNEESWEHLGQFTSKSACLFVHSWFFQCTCSPHAHLRMRAPKL